MRRRSVSKVDLMRVLETVRSDPGLRYGEYVTWLMDLFSAGERAAKDALGVLHAAGFLITTPDSRDGRVRRYRITEKGLRAVEAPAGAAILAFARALYSTCVPPKRRQ